MERNGYSRQGWRVALILAGERERVAAYVTSRIRHQEPFVTGYEALGALDTAGRLIGGVIYAEHRQIAPGEYDLRMHCAGEPGWLTKKSLRAFFLYPFEQLECIRVTATVARANKRALDMNRRLGFKIEGCIKDGFGTGKDGLILGMRRQDCRWIKEV